MMVPFFYAFDCFILLPINEYLVSKSQLPIWSWMLVLPCPSFKLYTQISENMLTEQEFVGSFFFIPLTELKPMNEPLLITVNLSLQMLLTEYQMSSRENQKTLWTGSTKNFSFLTWFSSLFTTVFLWVIPI